MKNFKIFIFCFLIASLLNGERILVRFENLPKNLEIKNLIKKNEKYKFIVLDSDVESVKKLFPDAISVCKEPKVKVFYNPNDTYFSYQWSLDERHYNLSYILDTKVDGDGVRIGILDTGSAYEDFSIPSNESSLVSSTDGKYHKYQDFDNINFILPYDFVNDDNHPNDMNGHGTAVTSVIASHINNSFATAGIVSSPTIIVLRVLDENGEGDLTNIVDAIEYAVANGCKVLNLSLGGPAGDSTGWTPLHQAIINARNNGVAVVCASGNEGVGELSYPAGFEEAISCGAVDYNFDRTYYSQYGTNLDFVAPGGVVYQDNDGDGNYDGGILCPMIEQTDSLANVSNFYLYWLEGTSFSTPHLSSLFALMFSLGYNLEEIVDIFISNSLDLGNSGYDLEYGYGYVKPDYIFKQDILTKSINYSSLSNLITFSFLITNDSVSIDSFKLKSLLEDENLNYQKDGKIYTLDIFVEKSGIYNLTIYGKKDGTPFQQEKSFGLKNILDNSTFIFGGNMTLSSDNQFLILDDSSSIKIKTNSKIKITKYTSESERLKVFSNDIELPVTRYEDRVEFYVEKDSYLRFLISNEKFDVFKNTKTLILKDKDLNWTGEEYSIFDRSGRIVEKGVSKKISFENIPYGIYFLKGKNILWKIVKLF
uniref:Peptidase S8/S53 domain-containing protein n=1 Tax=candidate division WOR-3 bacterium TaxID=2052148 RepID=A0A7C3N7H8_UNCW3